MDPTLKQLMEEAFDATGITDPGPTMRVYMDSLGISRLASPDIWGGTSVTSPPTSPSKPTIKHLGRPRKELSHD